MAKDESTVTALVVSTHLDVRDADTDEVTRYGRGEKVTLSARDFQRLSTGRRPAVASEDAVTKARLAQAQAARDAAQAQVDALTAQIDGAAAAAAAGEGDVNPSAVGDAPSGVDNPIRGGVVNLEPDEDDDVGDVNPPPTSGPGSGEAAWREYARTVGDPDWETAKLADLKARHADTGTDADNG